MTGTHIKQYRMSDAAIRHLADVERLKDIAFNYHYPADEREQQSALREWKSEIGDSERLRWCLGRQ